MWSSCRWHISRFFIKSLELGLFSFLNTLLISTVTGTQIHTSQDKQEKNGNFVKCCNLEVTRFKFTVSTLYVSYFDIWLHYLYLWLHYLYLVAYTVNGLKLMFLQWLLLIYPVVSAIKIKNIEILSYLHVLIVVVQCINYIYLKLL